MTVGELIQELKRFPSESVAVRPEWQDSLEPQYYVISAPLESKADYCFASNATRGTKEQLVVLE